MTTVDDALDAAAAAAAAGRAATGRLDAVERHQLTMTTQLARIAQQRQDCSTPVEVAAVVALVARAEVVAAAPPNDAASIHHVWISYTATRHFLSFAPGGIAGAISASLTS